VRIIVDTNVLIRSATRDNSSQADIADELLRSAASIAISVSSLCEFSWVLRRIYRFSTAEVCSGIRALLDISKVVTNRPVVEAGLAFMQAGGDFADGAIAYEGRWLGGETFVSFDRKAVELVASQGYSAQLLS